MNSKITEMKNTLEVINSRITEAEEWISDLEDRIVEFTAVEQNKEKRMKRNEDSLRDLWDNIKQKPHSQKDRQDEKAEGYVPDYRGPRRRRERERTRENI